ncbi:MAG: methyltransferase domain-containing protein [Cyanobacteria bacterium SID2]|nr:methyltransferase domain-containing protein [Cyanobacteria bacterium SID2]
MTDTAATPIRYDVERAVLDRYQAGAKQVEASLCCPTEYETHYLDILPDEILQKDYGCGDPSRHVNPGETVVDLGSGAGKICYILSQKVGRDGRIIGIDFNDEMLSLARKYREDIAQKIGYQNVEFFKGKIQDLALSLDKLQTWLDSNPVQTIDDLAALEAERDRLRSEDPAIPDNTVDVVVSNCVLNLVRPQDKTQLFREIFRVLKRGGRAVISDIVCDEEPTEEMMNDPELWSGCLSGAFREDRFLEMFEAAGFYGVEILVRQDEPWQVVNGVEFRSMTVRAYKGKEGDCWERNQAVVYKGPWKQVRDDDGHVYHRGQRMAVCDKTFQILTSPNSSYQQDIIPVLPHQNIPLDAAQRFDCKRSSIRSPQETKGANYRETRKNDAPVCGDGTGCC